MYPSQQNKGKGQEEARLGFMYNFRRDKIEHGMWEKDVQVRGKWRRAIRQNLLFKYVFSGFTTSRQYAFVFLKGATIIRNNL